MDKQQLAQMTSEMTADKWRLVPIELVDPSIVKLIKDSVSVLGLLNAAKGGEPKSGDMFPHIVSVKNTLWAEDGSHRILIWRIRGCPLMPMRVLRLE